MYGVITPYSTQLPESLSMCEIFLLFQVKIVDWPFEENGLEGREDSIHEYLSQNKFDLVINIPMRQSGARKKSHFITHGYRTRRMAIDHSVPLITDIKCAKLMCEVRNRELREWEQLFHRVLI